MRKLIVATRNKGKIREIADLLSDLDLETSSLLDYEDMPPIIEDGVTFADNAMIKARIIGCHTGCLVMGEDSGIEVDVLGGKPGVHSARFASLGKDIPDENDDDEANNDRMLSELQGVKHHQRTARYRSFIALCDGENEIGIVDGDCEGIIATERRGTNGFGYDPLFMPQGYEQTFGQLDPSVKKQLSHRAKALKKFCIMLAEYLS